MDSPAAVKIDLRRTQKYVLLVLHSASKEVTLLRGSHEAEFHADVKEAHEGEILAAAGPGSKLSCPGGGRITFTQPNTYRVHGYSVGFGKADHAISAALLRGALPQECIVTFDDEGY